MKIHILGICGTFMGGVAVLAKQLGHEVSGCDAKVYPPMSTQLREQGIHLVEGYDAPQLDNKPDLVIVGNAMKRGMPVVERVLNEGLPYVSGPQWLAENLLPGRWPIAVAATHGKTTTSSMIAWILEFAGLQPGFLIGGVPENFGVSARLGQGQHFILEADEYDSAFFDKRSKFIHYHPRTLLMNNLEFDHADIFDNVEAIQKQFHHLVRTIPSKGLIIAPKNDENLAIVLKQGCWTPVEYVGETWQAKLHKADGSEFEVYYRGEAVGTIVWNLLGQHNVDNALGALASAHHAGVDIKTGIAALANFKNVKRRLELRGTVNNIKLYDDFAHHPTAITKTLGGLRAKVGDAPILAVAELGSYTMRSGAYDQTLLPAFDAADKVWLYIPEDSQWDLSDKVDNKRIKVFRNIDEIIQTVSAVAVPGDHILVMSNRGFGGIHEKLLEKLK